MLFPIKTQIISALGLAAAVSSAPLNERPNAKRGIVGWLCHYDGPSSPLVNASLDLPALLGALCAKVNYDFSGCESFAPNPNQAIPHQSPQDDGIPDQSPADNELPDQLPQEDESSTQSAFVDQDNNQADGGQKEPKPKKQHVKESDRKHPKPKKNKSQHHNGGDEGQNPVASHSFNSNDDEPQLSNPSHGLKKPHKPSSGHAPSPSVGSLSNGLGDDDNAHGCHSNERYSPQVDRCVDQSYFSQPRSDGTCKEGVLDAVLELCLDVSILGLTNPIHAEVSALNSGSGGNGSQKCPLGQQYSSLLSVCVDDTFFSQPLTGDRCEHGWKLDLVLGICLDIIGCQDHDS